MATTRIAKTIAAALAASACAGIGAAAAFAASPAQPYTEYTGSVSYPGRKKPFSIKTNSTAGKVIVTPSYWRPGIKCHHNWRGVFEHTDLFNSKALKVRSDGSFKGTGKATDRFDESEAGIASWTVKGRFTSAKTAAGTMRISYKLRVNGRTALTCSALTVKWRTTRAEEIPEHRRTDF